jgi:diadenosine tetraphosphate (Ap4A) HIT family hydrolase
MVSQRLANEYPLDDDTCNQDVWHYHVHVTPRYTGDEFYNHFTGGRALMPVEERAKHARKLRVHLTGPTGTV